MERDDDFEILKKALEFTISVYTAANPECGFSFVENDSEKTKSLMILLNRI